MRIPLVQFTTGRLMIAVLMLGLALSGAISLLPELDQMAFVQRAEARHEKARQAREVAEVVKQYTPEPVGGCFIRFDR
jgi:hypothetical protein